jgi:ADP-ribose pyrophosphatase YjhB (NUDIX family)
VRTFGVNIAILSAGKVLLTLREDFEVWCLPGGMVDEGETLAEAAVREVREETGLDVELGRLVGLYARPSWHVGPYEVAVFTGSVSGGTLSPDPREVLEAAWFDPDELPSELLLGQRLRILHAVGGRAGLVQTSAFRFPFASIDAGLAARDASVLPPAAFYAEHVVRPNAELEQEELAAVDDVER